MLTNHAIVAALEEDLLWQLPFFFNALKKDIPVKLLLSFFVKEKQLLFLVKQYSRL